MQRLQAQELSNADLRVHLLPSSVAHQIYDVPFDTAFILNRLRIDFTSFAELDKPVLVNSTVSEKEFKRGMLTSMLYAGNFVQDGQVYGNVSGCDRLAQAQRHRGPATGQAA
ncbi:MAG: hypothetical protein GY720_18030 [bacterium]|nr:hypothetical protein [bacterium]